MPDYLFAFYFDDDDQVGVTGLTGTVDIKNVVTGASVETGLTPVEVGDGVYSIIRTLAENDYTGVMKTAANGWRASLSVKEIPRIDAAMTSRLADADYTAPDNAGILAAIAAGPAAFWSYIKRTLTMTPAEIISAMNGPNITVKRGDTFSLEINDLGDLSERTALYMTVKTNKGVGDDDALVQIKEGIGLIRLNGQEATAANAGIVIDEEGIATLTLKSVTTDALPLVSGAYWDVQVTKGDAVRTAREGSWNVDDDVTRRLS